MILSYTGMSGNSPELDGMCISQAMFIHYAAEETTGERTCYLTTLVQAQFCLNIAMKWKIQFGDMTSIPL